MNADTERETFTYRYYTIGLCNPIRVLIDANGYRRGAEQPDAATGGFKKNAMMLTRVADSVDSEEIDEVRFNELCGQVYARSKAAPVPGQ
jgi:hypothetical protein